MLNKKTYIKNSTKKAFQPFVNVPITDNLADEIALNIKAFFELLLSWSKLKDKEDGVLK